MWATLRAYFKVIAMKSQHDEHILLSDHQSYHKIRSLVSGYILNCRCEAKSPATIENYTYRLNCFIWFCQAQNYPDEPQNIKPDHIRQFLYYLSTQCNRWGNNTTSARKPASQSTINHYYRVLHTFFNWLSQEELITDNPLHHIKAPKLEYKVIQALTPEEVKLLFGGCSSKSHLDVRNRAILMMFLDTGLRVSELVNLNLDDIDTKTGTILVRYDKGSKERIVRIGNRAQKALWRYLTIYRQGYHSNLFLSRSGYPLTSTGVKLMVRRLAKQSCIPNVHVHRLRHTFAISFLRAGGDVFSLQYLLGHSTLQMTHRYLQSLNANDAINAHRRFSPLDRIFVI